jgi:transaldolase
MISRIQQLYALGQAIWLDDLSRDLIQSGTLARLVDDGVAGVTTNPTIFAKAISGSRTYDAAIATLARQGRTAPQIYEALVLEDVGAAADVLRSVFNETHGRDGFVSIEVRPALADDTDGTLAEARRLFQALARPNVMIKVPATEAGLPAIATLIGEGINVNVTLLFSVARYERVVHAYLEGLRRFQDTRRPLSSVSSVASFFVSRIDTRVDAYLGERIARGDEHFDDLLGAAAVAWTKVAYAKYKELFEGDRFAPLRAAGARMQRPLWASTSTKDPTYLDTKYVDALIGVNTVNAVPANTLAALRDHGIVAQTLEQELPQAHSVLRRLFDVGVDLEVIAAQLLHDGVRQFADSLDGLLQTIETRRSALTTTPA